MFQIKEKIKTSERNVMYQRKAIYMIKIPCNGHKNAQQTQEKNG